jgi:8-oxo-dGTP diphosphatase
MKQIEVVAAVIIRDYRFLCVQRGFSKLPYISEKWEFPGGKIEHSESMTEALEREIREELGMQLQDLSFFTTISHNYPDFSLTMHAFLCTSDQAEPILTEHLDYVWLPVSEMESLDWAAADIPIVDLLIERFAATHGKVTE